MYYKFIFIIFIIIIYNIRIFSKKIYLYINNQIEIHILT